MRSDSKPLVAKFVQFVWNTLNSNFISSLFGGLLAAILFWKFFEQKVKDLFTFIEKKRLSKRFVEEMLYNLIVARNVISKRNEYLSTNTFSFLEYETDNIEKFVKSEPLELNQQFYMEVGLLRSVLKKDNKLMDIFWFSPGASDVDRHNYKVAFLDNAIINERTILTLLNNTNFLAEAHKIKITDISTEVVH